VEKSHTAPHILKRISEDDDDDDDGVSQSVAGGPTITRGSLQVHCNIHSITNIAYNTCHHKVFLALGECGHDKASGGSATEHLTPPLSAPLQCSVRKVWRVEILEAWQIFSVCGF